MFGIFVRLNLAILSLATALHAFDARLFALRQGTVVQADSLIHYNMLLTWWRHGDSPRGFTLTPSPYFIDMLVQLPIMLLAPDFEQFSYALACTYAVLILVSLYLVLRVALDAGAALALAVAGVTVVGFYKLAPFNFVVHAFVFNHTSEVFTTLGLLALLHVWFRPGAPRRRYAPYVYALAVAACVMSSPFFIATYCVPAAIAATAILGTDYVTRRRLAWFLVLTAIGALVGLVVLAIISRYAWPIRSDSYRSWWKAYVAFKRTIVAEPGGLFIARATVLAVIASIALAFVGRCRRWSIPTVFMLAFFPATVLACVAIPIKRGAFDGGYAFRYVLLPWLLMVGFYAATAARLAKAVAAAVLRRRPLPAMPRWLPWTSAVLGVAGIALIATCHGSMTMTGEASRTSAMIRCFRDAEQSADLRDGLGTWWVARYLNAARHADGWESPHVIVQLQSNTPVDARDNNLLWFDREFRGGKGDLNFLITHGFDESLALIRERVGAPDRTMSCSVPPTLRVDARETFDIWIWDRAEAKQTLTELVLRDNLRSPFSPVIGATSMAIDLIWGMYGDPLVSALVGGHRVWRRQTDADAGGIMATNSMFLPNGRYRLDLELTAVPLRGSTDPVAEVHVFQDRHGDIAIVPIAAGTNRAVIEFEIETGGAPTSGHATSITLITGAAASIEVSGATLTLVEQRGISPFRIFH